MHIKTSLKGELVEKRTYLDTCFVFLMPYGGCHFKGSSQMLAPYLDFKFDVSDKQQGFGLPDLYLCIIPLWFK